MGVLAKRHCLSREFAIHCPFEPDAPNLADWRCPGLQALLKQRPSGFEQPALPERPAFVSPRQILVTSALPYANGHIHIGHLVEYIQTDIWVRFQKLRGHRCVYVCADDTHGTAIMIRARQEGRPEVDLIADMRTAHINDFAGFDVEFDHYGSTNSEDNRALCHEIWAALREKGLVVEEDVTQLFDTQAGTFLADRFVKGTCPKCKAPDQYGDNCEKCVARTLRRT